MRYRILFLQTMSSSQGRGDYSLRATAMLHHHSMSLESPPGCQLPAAPMNQSHSAPSGWEAQIPGLCFHPVRLLFTEQSFQILKPGDGSICYCKLGPGVARRTEPAGRVPIHTHLAPASKSILTISWHSEAVTFMWGLPKAKNWSKSSRITLKGKWGKKGNIRDA